MPFWSNPNLLNKTLGGCVIYQERKSYLVFVARKIHWSSMPTMDGYFTASQTFRIYTFDSTFIPEELVGTGKLKLVIILTILDLHRVYHQLCKALNTF